MEAEVGSARALRPGRAAAAGLLALALAGMGEARIEAGDSSGIGLALYVAAALLFSFGAWPLRLPASPPAAAAVSARSRLAVLLAANAAAIGLGVFNLAILRKDAARPEAPWLWLASLVLLAVGATLGRTVTAFAPRWGGAVLPASRAGRAALSGAVLVLLAVSAAVRFTALDRIPAGINADEGDRAAVSLWMLRGDYGGTFFGSGWYHISNVYFRLLACVLDVTGFTVTGVRLLGAFLGLATVAVVVLIGTRNFGWRVGLLAGTFLSALGAALQFSREATEATPTAFFWTVAAAFLLEGARTGRAWAWAGAGLAGGFSLYFYPPGRLWPVLAALFGVALLLRGPRGLRGRIALGLSIAAIAALAIMGPFLQHSIRGNTFAIRAKETSVLVPQGRGRVPWDRREWSLPRLLVAQVDRSFGIFNRYGDNNFFWPTNRPILPGALSVLALVGLGAACLKPRDPRMVLLVVWFWLGFVGVIVTVETPALQRMTGAIPVLALFPALVLDDLVRRLSALAEVAGGPARRVVGWAATAAAVLVAAALTAREGRYYFVDYGEHKEPWWYPNLEGQTVAAQGSDSWVFGVGPHQHKLGAGWVRFLAPTTPRGGLRYPGSILPIAIPANRDLTFFVYRDQLDYLPYLKDVYPGGALRRIKPDENVWFATYRVPKAAWKAMQGARAAAAGNASVRVDRLGEPPPGAPRSAMRWSAALRAPRSGNYAFRTGPGPARLYVDGTLVLSVPDGAPSSSTTAGLVRGDHFVVLEAVAGGGGPEAVVEWAVPEETPRETPRFSPVPTACLEARDRPPGGLLGVVTAEGRPEQKRMDRALATSSLSHQLGLSGPFTAVWTGTLTAPASGLYRFAFRAEGVEIELTLDGRALPELPRKRDEPAWREISLAAGPHAVRVTARVASGPGALEWIWEPPGGPVSIVPPSVLAPPERTGAGPPFAPEALGPWSAQPRDELFTPQR